MLLSILAFESYSQKDRIGDRDCSIQFKGIVYARANDSLPYATVHIKEINKGTTTDERGNFIIKNICKGIYTVECSYIGYATIVKQIQFHQDVVYDFNMLPEEMQVEEVEVRDTKPAEVKKDMVTQVRSEIMGKELDRTRGLSLGESLKSIPGIYSIQTGPSISKPVIHGLHSNRILIVNNGVRQEGQQWGSEHAPEIDPFIATKLTVIKGATSIRYGSDAIGGVILIDPKPMPVSPGINGEANLVGMSNGYSGTSSGMVQGAFGKKLTGLSWRLQGTYKRSGNLRTPHYYMDNTAFKEANYSSAIAYRKKNYGGEIYYSQFDTKLGIFSGTHAETVSDILAAIQRPKPITPDVFSYTINRPYQLVKHGLFKARAFIKPEKEGKLEVVFARQQNERSEYDYVPLNGNLNPGLFLRIITHTLDLIYEHKPVLKNIKGSIGFNGITQGNVREFQFLIPNFRNYGGGLFMIERWKKKRLTIEGGLRYDYRWLRVYMLDNNTAQVVTPTYHFSNVTIASGAKYSLSEKTELNANFSTAWKAPTVNELFSNGVHQSAASYETGNPNLVSEYAYNLNASLTYTGKYLNVDFGLYNNIINNYTYLKPDLKAIHTVRGSFPSFTYTQVNAVFRGIDLKAEYTLKEKWVITSKISYIYAYNKTIHDYLIYTPPNRMDNSIRYEMGKIGKLQKASLGIINLNVARQTHVPPNSDFAPPPKGYTLFGANIGFELPAGGQNISFDFSVRNLFNKAYKDYLNRFRYFTDDLGRNFIIRIKVPFEILKNKNAENN